MAKRRRSNKKEPKGVIYLIVLACLAAVFHEPIANALRNKLPVPTEKTAKRAETTETTGNPLLPAPLKNVPEQILHRKGYTASYNREHKIPNWVAWELTPEKLIERESRTDKFLPDPDLPESQAVTTDDYKRSGMDRGHMCPAGDNRWHWKAMQESFYMTNICPQNHNLKHRTIGKKHKITVPEAFFKVILCTNSNPPKAIGFIYKNTSGNHPLDTYVNSVDEVERITGIDFFPALPDNVEKQVEAAYNLDLWKKE